MPPKANQRARNQALAKSRPTPAREGAAPLAEDRFERARRAFHQGDFVTAARDGDPESWEKYAALGLVGLTEPAINGLKRQNGEDARFYRGVAYWMAGRDQDALPVLRHIPAEHARNLARLIEKPKIRILAQLPWLRGGHSDFFSLAAPDPKFEVDNISFHPEDRANRPWADVSDFVQADDPPDFYLCKMVEWHAIPPNLQDLPCPLLGQTADYDMHIQAVYPWLQIFDEMVVTDPTEWADVRRLAPCPVSTFPKSFGVRDAIPYPPPRQPPRVDVFQSGSLLHPYHPDKLGPLRQALALPDGARVWAVDGFTFQKVYDEILQNTKATFTFIRHPGAMPTRGIEALGLGTAVVVQEGSCLSLWAGPEQGLFTYSGDQDLREKLLDVIVHWDQNQSRALAGARIIHDEFTLSKVASQYYRFMTVLAARPRPPRTRVPRESLVQKRMVVSKGWLPKDPLTLREMSRETVKRLDQIPVTERRASVFNDLGRELTLEFAGEMLRQTLRAEEDPIKPEPMVIEGAFAVLADGIRRFPESLPLRFNAVRAALHFGLDKEVKWALALARDTLGIPYREWDVDPLEDVFPWDFFSPFFNYRAYFDRVTQSLGGGPGPNPDLARLIFASIHHYLSHFLNPLDHAPQAAALDPGFPFYTYKWVLALLERGQSQDVAQAIRLLTGLADGSILAPEALVLLQRIEEAGIPLGFDRNMVSWFGQRMNDGKAMAKAVNAYVSPSEWRVTRLARPTETSKV